MDTKLATYNYRIQQWSQIIHDRAQSGLKVDEYCELHNLSRHKYYYWLKRVREAAISTTSQPTEDTIEFVEISSMSERAELYPSTNDIAARLCLGNHEITITNQASSEFIKNLLGAVYHVQ